MSPIKIINMIHEAVKIAYNLDYNSDKDSIEIHYTVGGKKYDMLFIEVSSIESEQQAKHLISVIQANIQYHINELENKLQ